MGDSARTLLIVDDDPHVQLTYKYCFEQAGYKVGVAANGNAAIAYLKTRDVNTVFLDIFMPDKEGLETLLEIKKLHPRVKVIVMTGGGANPRHDFLSIASKFGADGVVRKPFSPQEMISMLEAGTFRAMPVM